ncbi:MAG TPA: disulfide bond formation protein B [Gaiellaceae bacterium]
MTHDVTVTLAVLGVAGQALAALLLLVALARLGRLRELVEGYELWLVFAVSAIATGGSLFFSEIAGFVPCELCWFQRICMYPLSIASLLAAAANDRRASRYLLPLPLVGAGVSVYHLLIENGAIKEPSACQIGGAGCAVKWINEFGYMTIPTLALTGFALCFAFLLLGALPPPRAATVTE